MNLAVIIALIGCVTGLLSLGISLYKAVQERGSVSFECPITEINYFFPQVTKHCRTTYQAVIYFRVINKSVFPVTIYDISCEIDNQSFIPMPFKENAIDLQMGDPNFFGSGIQIDMSNSFDTPCVVSPFEVYQGFLFLKFFPDTLKISVDAKIKINSTRGERSLLTTLLKWNPENKQRYTDGAKYK